MSVSSLPEQASLLVASTNRGKVSELRRALASFFSEVLSLNDFPDVPIAPEDQDTFAGNACQKASHYLRHARPSAGLFVLADDSGLVVDALGGRPGVHSARYAGPEATDQRNIDKLLAELDGVENRSASFVAVLALHGPGGLVTAYGACEGAIARSRRGTGGFGYDSVFVPNGYTQTFGEKPELKDDVSHRAEAIRALLGALQA